MKTVDLFGHESHLRRQEEAGRVATPTRIRRRGRWSLILGTIFAFAAFAAVAYSDDISNNLDATADASAEVMALNVGGADGTTRLYVVPQNGDGKNGCNFGGTTGTLEISLASSNTSAATVSPSSITISSCVTSATGPLVTVTPQNAGSATISATLVSNGTGASFNLAPFTFTVNVAPPPNTAPSIEVAGVTGGASYDKGSVPVATCDVTDAEDGDSSFAATLSAITGPYASDGIGQQTASCSYTDGGGVNVQDSLTYNIVDPTAPTIAYTINPDAVTGLNGWYTSAVTVTWTVTDGDSTPTIVSGCGVQTFSADTTGVVSSCSAASAGGEASDSVTLKIDKTGPSAALAVTAGTAGMNGWYTSNVTVGTSGADSISGPVTCTPDQSQSTETAGVTFNGSCTNDAGLTTNASPLTVKLDKTAPVVALVGGPANGESYYFGSVPATPTCTASDVLAGLAGSCSVSGYSTSVGQHTVSASATDNAGNVGSSSRSYTVLAWTLNGFFQPVDMGASVFNTVKSGSTVPLKFRVFSGSTELTDVSAVKSLSYVRITCAGVAIEDAIEEIAPAGGTLLRYDSTGGQFIYNLKTSGKAADCYRATMTTLDGSTLVANFKLK